MRPKCRERFLCHRLQRKPLVSDPDMHHGTCVSHVPWFYISCKRSMLQPSETHPKIKSCLSIISVEVFKMCDTDCGGMIVVLGTKFTKRRQGNQIIRYVQRKFGVISMRDILYCPGGRFKNTYELLNLRALEISKLHKNHIFQCMGKIFSVEFQRVPLKFHTKYLTHTLKDVDFIHIWKFKSSQSDIWYYPYCVLQQ